MAYDLHLADRMRRVFKEKHVPYIEKKMFGGLCFLVDEKMCAGIVKDNLMARIDPEIYLEVLKRQGCRPMDFSGKSMKGFVFVEPIGIDMDNDLDQWIQLCLDYNPKARASKKKKA